MAFFVDVLWDGESTVSLFAVEKLRPRALALQRSYAAAAIVTQQQKLQQKHMQLTPPVSALAYVGVMTPEIELALRNNEAVTPSHGYLTPSSVTNHAWMCHMCRKKFFCAEGVTPHLETKIHDRRRQLTYSFADWVAYNFGFGFYELEAELAQHGPPPPQHIVAFQFASAEASEVNPQEASWSETLQPHVVAPALEQRTQFSPSSGSSSFAPHATTAAPAPLVAAPRVLRTLPPCGAAAAAEASEAEAYAHRQNPPPGATDAALREGDSEIAPPPLTFLPPQPLPRRPTIFEGVEYDC